MQDADDERYGVNRNVQIVIRRKYVALRALEELLELEPKKQSGANNDGHERTREVRGGIRVHLQEGYYHDQDVINDLEEEAEQPVRADKRVPEKFSH